MSNVSELVVITNSKKLLSYITTVTEKSPIKFRYSFVTKMHTLAIEVIENLYYANMRDLRDERRLEHQNTAKVKVKLLDYVCESAKDVSCITMSQYSNISKEIMTVLNLIDGWINSDNARKNK